MLTKTDRKWARRKSINDREFLIAVVDEDHRKVNSLINENVNINYKDRDDCTALHLAAANGDLNAVKLLVNKGAAFDVQNIDGETPLDIAKRLNELEIVKVFEDINDCSSQSILLQNQQIPFQNQVCEYKHGVFVNAVHGNIYQLKVLMLFLYRGVACKYSFHLGTEIKEAKKFDDLVFEYTENGKKIYRLLQAKHKIDETKKITVDSLLTETNGDYSLVKYFVSYQASKKEIFFINGTIKDVTICTNIDFDLKSLQEAQIEIEKILEKDNILDLKSEGKEPKRYKFSKKLIPKLKARLQSSKLGWKCKISNDEIDDFLQHLVFAVNQPNEEELGIIVKNEISKEFDYITTENTYNKFFIQMLDWMKSRNRGAFWSYKDGKNLFEEVKKGMPVWYNVQDPIKLFTGRKTYLNDIHKLFQTEKEKIICVSGLGGVGKSELAKKYVTEYSQCYDNKVIWINAESYQTLVDSFRELACEKLGIKTRNADGKEKEISTIVVETFQYLSNGKSLFVFDNSEMYKSQNKLDAGIDRFLPRLPNGCQKPYILITSRNQKWPENVIVTVLEGFTETEATSFITKSLQLQNEKQSEYVADLGKKLQLLPLALQQAVAYIRVKNDKLANIESGFQISDYLKKLTEGNKDIFNFEFSSDSDNTYIQTVYTSWNVTLAAIQEKENGKVALDILNIASYFLPDNIPINLLFILKHEKDILASAIELLKQYSLINVQYKTLNVHRVVQQITRLKLDDRNEEEEVLKMILEKIREDNVGTKNVDHLMCLWSYCFKYIELIEKYYNVVTFIAEELTSLYRYDEAKEVIKKVIELLQKRPKNNINTHIALLAVKTSSACIIFREGKCEAALHQLLEIYKVQEATDWSYNEFTLKTMRVIVLALEKLNKTDEALKWAKKVLRANQAIFGENHPETVLAKIQIADISTEEGEYEEALSILKQVCDIYITSYGSNNIATTNTKSSIALIFKRQHKYEEALKIFQVTYNAKKEMLGENHPSTLNERIYIADIYAHQADKYNLAIEIFEEVLTIKLGMLEENHPEIIELQINIAQVLQNFGKYDRSLEIWRSVLQKQRTNLGSYHRDVFDTQLCIATILQNSQGESIEELQLLEDLLNFEKSVLSVKYTEMNIRNRIVAISIALKKGDKALEHSVKIFELYENIFGKNHIETLEMKTNVGLLYYGKEDYNKALEILTEVQKVQERTLGIEDSNYKIVRDVIREIAVKSMVFGKNFLINSMVKNPFVALQNYNFDVFKKLLQAGLDPNSQDQDGRSFLHIAAAGDNLEIVNFLIKKGVDVTRASNNGDTALHIATSKNRIAIAGALLDSVSYVELNKFIDAKSKSTGDTALHIASRNGFYEMMKLLLSRGATYDINNKSNESPTNVARDLKVRRLQETVDVNFQYAKTLSEEYHESLRPYFSDYLLVFTNARNADGYNLVQVGVMNNHENLVQDLAILKWEILRCWKPTFDCHSDELLTLATAALTKLRDGNCNEKTVLKCVRKLVETFRSRDKRTVDPNILAIEDMLRLMQTQKNAESLMKLANVVIDIHVKLFSTSICAVKLLEVSRRNDLASVEYYVKQDTYVNLVDDAGWTPLLHAVNVGNEKMVELLLEHDAEMNCTTQIGKNTPLHVAVYKGHLKIVEILLRQCKSRHFINMKTEAKGSTAMHVAAKNGRSDIVMLLLNYGAAYCLKNKDGKTPMDLVDDDSIKKFFRLIDELFEDVAKGSIRVVQKIATLEPREFSAAVSACNEEEFTLSDFARVKEHEQLFCGIRSVIERRCGAVGTEFL